MRSQKQHEIQLANDLVLAAAARTGLMFGTECEDMNLTNEVFSNPFDYMRNLKDTADKDVANEMELEEPSSSQQSFPSKSLL